MTETPYSDEQLVYVDPDKRRVIGPVEFTQEGNPKRKEVEQDTAETTAKEGKPPRRTLRKRYYPWCSYKTAKRVYRVEGKQPHSEEYEPFETVLTKALVEPFWD